MNGKGQKLKKNNKERLFSVQSAPPTSSVCDVF